DSIAKETISWHDDGLYLWGYRRSKTGWFYCRRHTNSRINDLLNRKQGGCRMIRQMKGLMYYYVTDSKRPLTIFWSILLSTLIAAVLLAYFFLKTDDPQ